VRAAGQREPERVPGRGAGRAVEINLVETDAGARIEIEVESQIESDRGRRAESLLFGVGIGDRANEADGAEQGRRRGYARRRAEIGWDCVVWQRVVERRFLPVGGERNERRSEIRIAVIIEQNLSHSGANRIRPERLAETNRSE